MATKIFTNRESNDPLPRLYNRMTGMEGLAQGRVYVVAETKAGAIGILEEAKITRWTARNLLVADARESMFSALLAADLLTKPGEIVMIDCTLRSPQTPVATFYHGMGGTAGLLVRTDGETRVVPKPFGEV
jgi:hypothetical protein